ncbi:MAG: glycosyltransferase family 4 protein [Acidobacteriota bacterium]
MAKPKTFLAAIGDANNPITWSGIPYHFLQSARSAGLIDEGLQLSSEGGEWRARRIAWNIRRLATGERYGGYQYSPTFLEKLWSRSLRQITDGTVINCFQLFPPSVVKDPTVRKWFFIDQTLLQLFDYYDQRQMIGRRIARETVEQEREGYHAAVGIIAHSKWAAKSVINDYGIAANKVHVVVPGANLDCIEYARWETAEVKQRHLHWEIRDRPLRLVFVGKHWSRKGLDRLLRAMKIARLSGSKATLRIIGCRREDLPSDLRILDGIEWMDFIDKRSDGLRFFRAVAECDVGCLLSRVEAGGIALREYHALGLVALGPDTGGAREHMIQDGSVPVSPRATEEEIANTLIELESNPTWFDSLRIAAWKRRRSALWDESVRQMISFWPYTAAGFAEKGRR